MAIQVLSSKLEALVDPGSSVEPLATGFKFTEGPLWNPWQQCLLFSDMPGNIMRAWSETGGVREIRRPSAMSNGLTYDSQMRLVACEHETRRVTRTEADGSIQVVADTYSSKPLNSPNDVVVRSDGTIYFTDPNFGLRPFFGIEREQDLPYQGVYRVPPGASLELLVDDFAEPNGLCFSPDESLLYINDTERMHIRVFDADAEGRLSNGRVFFTEEGEGGVPDGMKVDVHGNVYCTGPGGIWVLSPQAEHLGVIEIPEHTANLNWGGPGWDTLYITASTSIYRLPMRVQGNRLAYMS